MPRPFLTVVLASAALLAAAPTASAAGVPAKYLNQTIDWQPCFTPGSLPPGLPAGSERLLCGTFTAPMDWTHPDRHPDISIAVSKLPATGAAQGSVLVNPGGPGASGWELPLTFLGRGKLTAAEDLIGFDVRGTGRSTNLTCDGGLYLGSNLDYRDRSPGNLDLILDSVRLGAEHCQRYGGEFGPLVNTEQTVRDLDLLRALLGRDRINWIGYSAGTWLGAYYATFFPGRVDKFVLDSNTEFTTSWQHLSAWQALGYQRRFEQDFQPWAARYDSTYHLGATPAAVDQTYETLRAKLAATPVTINGTTVSGAGLDTFVDRGLRESRSFPDLAQTFDTLIAAATKTPSPQAAAPLAADAKDATNVTIECNDTPWYGDRQSVIRNSGELGRKFPLFGYFTVEQPCIGWRRPALTLPTPTGRGVPPVLMVQDTGDPATPYEGAVRAHHAFAGSRLLTVQGQGDHGVYAATGNACVDDTVEAFIVDGHVPAGDLTCPGVPLPGPRTTTPNLAAPRAPIPDLFG